MNFLRFAFCCASTSFVANGLCFSQGTLQLERFEKTVVAEKLVQPMELDIASDGTIYLIELGGTLKRLDPKVGNQEVVGTIEVTTAQENGLIGMALDPDFAKNNWIYLQYSPPNFTGQHVSRFTLKDGKLDMESEKILFRYEEQRRECCHHAGSMEFGPDGCLYIGTGDNTNPFDDSQGYAPIDERPGREPWDAQRSSANTKSYNGKVLRIRPEPDGTYSIPDGNLFPKSGEEGHPEIYVMGCRNPWRISVDARTGFLYWGDVGPDAGGDNERGPRGYDEVNQARRAGNFGWPYFIGNNFAYSIVDFSTKTIGEKLDPSSPKNRSRNNTGAASLPAAQPAMIYYPGGASSEFPELGSGGRTACAGPVYYHDDNNPSTTKFPAEYHSTLFAFEWSRNAIYAAHLDEDSNLRKIERFLPNQTFVRPIDLQFDANGALYVIEYGETWGVNADAKLSRVDYVRGNRAPTAVAEVKNNIGREPLEVELNATKSSDKDGDPLKFQWEIVDNRDNKTNRTVVGQGAELKTTVNQPGVYTIELTVEDSNGAKSSMTQPLIVGNSRPDVQFLEPRDGSFYIPEKPIPFRIAIRDFEDGSSHSKDVDDGDYELIEGTAPNRVFVEASLVASNANEKPTDAPGLALMRKTDCLNCHSKSQRIVGPSFLEIANKYRDQPHQLSASAQRVIKGSSGVWGQVGMLPHSQLNETDVLKMVEYIFSLNSDSANPSSTGFRNEISVPWKDGRVQLSAIYTDLGRDDLPKLTGQTSITLRNPNVQAESADEFQGTQILNSGNAQGSAFMGAINHNGFLKFERISFDEMKAVAVRVASAGTGGTIEFRRGNAEGQLLGEVTVDVNGKWEEFYEKEVTLIPSEGVDSLFLVFKNPTNPGGLMNIDSFQVR
jgi:cytochrome c